MPQILVYEVDTGITESEEDEGDAPPCHHGCWSTLDIELAQEWMPER